MGEKEKRQEGHHHTLCEAPVLRGIIKPRVEPTLCGITPPPSPFPPLPTPGCGAPRSRSVGTVGGGVGGQLSPQLQLCPDLCVCVPLEPGSPRPHAPCALPAPRTGPAPTPPPPPPRSHAPYAVPHPQAPSRPYAPSTGPHAPLRSRGGEGWGGGRKGVPGGRGLHPAAVRGPPRAVRGVCITPKPISGGKVPPRREQPPPGTPRPVCPPIPPSPRPRQVHRPINNNN